MGPVQALVTCTGRRPWVKAQVWLQDYAYGYGYEALGRPSCTHCDVMGTDTGRVLDHGYRVHV